jgi:hypothetical protein
VEEIGDLVGVEDFVAGEPRPRARRWRVVV